MKLKKSDFTLKIFLDKLFNILMSECDRKIEEYELYMDYDNSYDSENELGFIYFIYNENFSNLDDIALDLNSLKMCYGLLCSKYSLDELYSLFSVCNSVLSTNDVYSDLDISIVKQFISGFYNYVFSSISKIPLCIKLVKEEYEKII